MLRARDLDLTRLIRPGDRLMWGQSVAEPRTLIGRLIGQREQLGGARVFLGIGAGGQLCPEHADSIEFLSYCGAGANRKLEEAGVLDILPVHYSHLPRLIRCGELRIDVLMLQVSPADASGRHSLGLAREYLVSAISAARVIIGEVHPDVPWTFGGPYLVAGDFAALVETDSDLPDLPATTIGPVEEAIGRNVASLVTDGATIQTGIGAVPDAVLAQLDGHRDLGLHSGSIGDGALRLIERGAVTNARKTVDRGVAIGGILMGGAALRRFAHRNPALELRGTEYTHGPNGLGQTEGLVAINSAVEVDLTGQVNSEVAGDIYVGAVGGINDFLRAAGACRRGVPIVALPSMAKTASRIVPRLTGPVTVARSDACVVVTEHGIADLRGISLERRVARMIAIAHPDRREELLRASYRMAHLS